METVGRNSPGTAARWKIAEEATARAVDAVRKGIKTACEISVALAPTKAEGDRLITEAETVLSGNQLAGRQAMGRHLEDRLEALDDAVSKGERSGWKDTPPTPGHSSLAGS